MFLLQLSPYANHRHSLQNACHHKNIHAILKIYNAVIQNDSNNTQNKRTETLYLSTFPLH